MVQVYLRYICGMSFFIVETRACNELELSLILGGFSASGLTNQLVVFEWNIQATRASCVYLEFYSLFHFCNRINVDISLARSLHHGLDTYYWCYIWILRFQEEGVKQNQLKRCQDNIITVLCSKICTESNYHLNSRGVVNQFVEEFFSN